jgi:hypothetical protein
MSRTFKIIRINNKNVNIGRYITNSSPSSVAKKVFTRLYKQLKSELKTFMIKETTQGSNKKIYGPYKGQRIKLKKPIMVKFKGKKELVPIRYDTKIYKVKSNKYIYKGGLFKSLRKKLYKRFKRGRQHEAETSPDVNTNHFNSLTSVEHYGNTGIRTSDMNRSNILESMKKSKRKNFKIELLKKFVSLAPYIGSAASGLIGAGKDLSNLSGTENIEKMKEKQILLYLYLQTRANFVALQFLIDNISNSILSIRNLNKLKDDIKDYKGILNPKTENNLGLLTRGLSKTSESLRNQYLKEKLAKSKSNLVQSSIIDIIGAINTTGILSYASNVGSLLKNEKTKKPIEETIIFKLIEQCIKDRDTINDLISKYCKTNNSSDTPVHSASLTRERSTVSSEIEKTYRNDIKKQIMANTTKAFSTLLPGATFLNKALKIKEMRNIREDIKNFNHLNDMTLNALLLNRCISKIIKKYFIHDYKCIDEDLFRKKSIDE